MEERWDGEEGGRSSTVAGGFPPEVVAERGAPRAVTAASGGACTPLPLTRARAAFQQLQPVSDARRREEKQDGGCPALPSFLRLVGLWATRPPYADRSESSARGDQDHATHLTVTQGQE